MVDLTARQEATETFTRPKTVENNFKPYLLVCSLFSIHLSGDKILDLSRFKANADIKIQYCK